MYAATDRHPSLRRLAAEQDGVARRDQIAGVGVPEGFVRHQIAAERWTALERDVVLLQNASPTRRQLMWIAVCDAGFPAAVCSHTSLELAGFRPMGHEAADVHIVVPRGAKTSLRTGVVVHESRRLKPEYVVRDHGIPRTENSRSAIDAAAWQPVRDWACAILAAVVQQRVATVPEIERALGRVGQVRHKRHMRLVLRDIDGGAESLGEVDVARMCRRFGLVAPDRQVYRRDSAGRRRYLDCEWKLPGGELVVLEVDGSHHMDVAHWAADMKRERSVVISRRWVLRATAFELRLEPAGVVSDLAALGVPRLTPTCQNVTAL